MPKTNVLSSSLLPNVKAESNPTGEDISCAIRPGSGIAMTSASHPCSLSTHLTWRQGRKVMSLVIGTVLEEWPLL